MRKHSLLVGLLICGIAACQSINTQLPQQPITPFPTSAIDKTPTAQPSVTVAPRYTPTRRPLPTPTPEPLPTNPYLIKVDQGAGDGVDEIAICLAYHPTFILFHDGRLLLHSPDGFVETQLSTAEIQDLLNRIEATGFFKVEDSEKGIYNLPDGYQYGDGGWGQGITVKDKFIWVNGSISQYAVKPVQDTFSIVAAYKPTGVVKPYVPDKAYLFVVDIDSGYFPLPDPHSVLPEWSKDLPVLYPSWGEIVWGKNDVKRVYDLRIFTHFPSVGIFSLNGKGYFVVGGPFCIECAQPCMALAKAAPAGDASVTPPF